MYLIRACGICALEPSPTTYCQIGSERRSRDSAHQSLTYRAPAEVRQGTLMNASNSLRCQSRWGGYKGTACDGSGGVACRAALTLVGALAHTLSEHWNVNPTPRGAHGDAGRSVTLHECPVSIARMAEKSE